MTEALKLVREALGPEAVILETRAVREGRGPRKGVMVMAAVDRHLETRSKETPAFGRPTAEREGPAAEAPRMPARPRLEEEVKRLQGRLFYLNRLITSDHFSTIPIPLRELYLDLIEAEVDSNLAFTLLKEVAEEKPTSILSVPRFDVVRERLRRAIPRGRPIPEDPQRRVVLLVGPPGSGKTTLTTSLAGRCLQAGRRPGLISIDTFRAGGPARLEHYAQVLDVPFVSVSRPADLMDAAARSLSGCDLILVDTPGITVREREAVKLVRQIQLSMAEPEVHGVLSATSKVRDSAAVLELLTRFHLSSLVFTRMDVTNSYGGVLSLSLKTRLPVSHLAWGRRVLEDLRDCAPDDLISLVLDQCARGLAETAKEVV